MSGDRPAAALRERPPSVPTPPSRLSLAALACALGVAAAAFWVAGAVQGAMAGGGIGTTVADIALYAFAAATLLLLIPAVRSLIAARPRQGRDARRPRHRPGRDRGRRNLSPASPWAMPRRRCSS